MRILPKRKPNRKQPWFPIEAGIPDIQFILSFVFKTHIYRPSHLWRVGVAAMLMLRFEALWDLRGQIPRSDRRRRRRQRRALMFPCWDDKLSGRCGSPSSTEVLRFTAALLTSWAMGAIIGRKTDCRLSQPPLFTPPLFPLTLAPVPERLIHRPTWRRPRLFLQRVIINGQKVLICCVFCLACILLWTCINVFYASLQGSRKLKETFFLSLIFPLWKSPL